MNPYSRPEIYVGNLNLQVDNKILFNTFSSFGTIIAVKVLRHIVTRVSRGFAFIEFKLQHEANLAKSVMNGKELFGKKLKVYLKSEYTNLDRSAVVVIRNLEEGVKEEEILKLMPSSEKPFSIKIVKQSKSENEDRAYVQLRRLEDANQIIEKLNNTEFKGRKITVELSNKKNKVYIKCKNVESVLEELRVCLSNWKLDKLEIFELSLDKQMCIVKAELANEEAVNEFIKDYGVNRISCKVIRSIHHRCVGQIELKKN
jgi:RNA recognition motif-containing protein